MLDQRPLITPHEVIADIERFRELLDRASDELNRRTRAYAEAALHYANSEEEVTEEYKDLGPTALDRIVRSKTAVAKAKRQIADYERSDALTIVVNLRAQLSSCQTEARLVESDMEMAS